MARVTVNWVLPTTRESGKPLAASAIKDVLIEVSADGTSFTTVGRYPPTTLTTFLDDVDYGEWFFRGTVFDTSGRASDPVVKGIMNEDTTPPSPLVLTLALS